VSCTDALSPVVRYHGLAGHHYLTALRFPMRPLLNGGRLGGQANVFRIVLRTPEEKADLDASWARPDEEFFASGACHVLAAAFLEAREHAGFHAIMIQPAAGFRGVHVVIANDDTIFDCRGWNPRDSFLQYYAEAMSGLSPGWSYTLASVTDPIGWEFCRTHRHRHPSQFKQDPMPRARAFLARFPRRAEA
jgi:hypothetical protein